MNRSIAIIFLIAFLIISYFAFTVFTKRESDLITKPETPTNQKAQETSIDTKTTDSTNARAINTESANEVFPTEKSNDTELESQKTESFYVHVTATDCARNCEPYKYNAKELKYCQNICGLSEKTNTNNCENLKDLEKDYCYKDQAIEKKDISTCEKISDAALKRTCKNRIQEDVIENM